MPVSLRSKRYFFILSISNSSVQLRGISRSISSPLDIQRKFFYIFKAFSTIYRLDDHILCLWWATPYHPHDLRRSDDGSDDEYADWIPMAGWRLTGTGRISCKICACLSTNFGALAVVLVDE